MSVLKILGGIAIISTAIIVSIALSSMSVYNSGVIANNNVDAKWSMVLSSYEQNFVSVAQHAQVMKFSVNAQLNMTLMNAAIREGRLISAADQDQMNKIVTTLDETAAGLMISVRVEAVPKLDTTQLTELNAAIESTLRVVKHARDEFTIAVMEYNNIIQTIPGVWFNSWFGWGFKPLKGFSPEIEHPPEENIDLGL